jgi:hypothetical protein
LLANDQVNLLWGHRDRARQQSDSRYASIRNSGYAKEPQVVRMSAFGSFQLSALGP